MDDSASEHAGKRRVVLETRVSVDVDIVEVFWGPVEINFPERRKWERCGGEEHES